jgi:hypothetical protein
MLGIDDEIVKVRIIPAKVVESFQVQGGACGRWLLLGPAPLRYGKAVLLSYALSSNQLWSER